MSKTKISIQGEKFLINDEVTYKGKSFNGKSIEGLLLNSRMVQATFDDLNPDTKERWAYPDTGVWDAERNVTEFLERMPEYRDHGLLAFTINLQGGSPQGYSKEQPWINSAFESDGSLRADYCKRVDRIIRKADELGMVVIVGYFYFGQEKLFASDDVRKQATINATQWLLKQGYRNILVEINNECTYHKTPIFMSERIHELIALAKGETLDGRSLLVATSYGGGFLPGSRVLEESDFVLLHGNSVHDPERISEMVRQTRAIKGYRPMPIVFNEDDHFDFDKPQNNFLAALNEGASWGYFDYRFEGEAFDEGYQSVPVNWRISSERKKGFFNLLKKITMS